MTRTLLLITCFVILSIAVQAQTTVPVYVFTKSDPSGLVDKDSKARTEAVADAMKALGKSKVVQPVSTPDTATVQVEITTTQTVEETDHLSALNNALNGAHNSDTKKVTYRLAILKVGDYSTELRGRNGGFLGREIESWVKANAARLARDGAK